MPFGIEARLPTPQHLPLSSTATTTTKSIQVDLLSCSQPPLIRAGHSFQINYFTFELSFVPPLRTSAYKNQPSRGTPIEQPEMLGSRLLAALNLLQGITVDCGRGLSRLDGLGHRPGAAIPVLSRF